MLENFPKVIVDKGAIQFVCKGANIMRPGIVNIPDNFNQNYLVGIIFIVSTYIKVSDT